MRGAIFEVYSSVGSVESEAREGIRGRSHEGGGVYVVRAVAGAHALPNGSGPAEQGARHSRRPMTKSR